MQAVILAAGKSSRFYPYNGFAHKSFIPIAGKPIIEHTLHSLKNAGIEDIIIVVAKNSSIPSLLGTGERFGVVISYAEQEDARGQGDGLLKAQKYIKGDFFLLHAHRMDIDIYASAMEQKRQSGAEIVLLAREEEQLGKFGVLKVEGDRVLDLVEKPTKGQEPSSLRVIGIYLLNQEFLDILSKIPEEHYSLEKALAKFAQEKYVRVVVTPDKVATLKYPWDILKFKNYLIEKLPQYTSLSAHVSENAQIMGNVYIDEGAKVLEGACIKGPCYIGKNVIIGNNALVRGSSDIEAGSTIGAYSEVKNCLFLENSSIHSGFIGDSVVGKGSRIGADFSSGNVRLKRDNVTAIVKDSKVDTGLRALGVIMGDNVKVGIRVVTMPGVIIGIGAVIGPSTTVMKNIPDNTTYYTEFKEIVEKKNEE